VTVDPLILNYCKKDHILHDYEVLQIAVRNAIAKDRFDTLARTALESGWAGALVVFAKALRTKVEAHWALEAFDNHAGVRSYPAHAPAVKSLIGSYLGIVPEAGERCQLQVLWRHRSVFFLALGGNVNELCMAYTFRTKRKRAEGYQVCDEWYDDDSDNNFSEDS
jgi:hypothetical protein